MRFLTGMGPALIALIGVILSLVISWIATRVTLKLEMRKLKIQLHQFYSQKLNEHRLSAYPKLFALLSQFSKDLRGNQLTRKKLEDLLANLDRWDSSNGILFTDQTIGACNRFRDKLIELLNLSSQQFSTKIHSRDFVSEWFRYTEVFELAIKAEIGVYGVDYSDAEEGVRLRTQNRYTHRPRNLQFVGHEQEKRLPIGDSYDIG